MELFNEVILMTTLYTMICFTPWIHSIEMKFKIGFVSCAIVALHFAVNLGIMTGTSIKQTIKSCRFKYTWKKYEEQRAEF